MYKPHMDVVISGLQDRRRLVVGMNVFDAGIIGVDDEQRVRVFMRPVELAWSGYEGIVRYSGTEIGRTPAEYSERSPEDSNREMWDIAGNILRARAYPDIHEIIAWANESYEMGYVLAVYEGWVEVPCDISIDLYADCCLYLATDSRGRELNAFYVDEDFVVPDRSQYGVDMEEYPNEDPRSTFTAEQISWTVTAETEAWVYPAQDI